MERMTVREAAELLGWAPSTLYYWRVKGIVKTIRERGSERVYFDAQEIRELAARIRPVGREMLTVKEAAHRLRLTENLVYHLLLAGMLRSEQAVGKHGARRVDAKSVERLKEFIARQQRGTDCTTEDTEGTEL